MNKSLINTFYRHFVLFVSTGCYAGYLPIVPGTFGSAVGVIIFFLLFFRLPTFYYIVNLLILLMIGFFVAGKAEIIFEEKDSGKIVIDEIIGYVVSMFLIPATLKNIILAFLFFRILDTIKFFPANVVEDRVPGGYGVILDDVIAGIYANLIMQSIVLF